MPPDVNKPSRELRMESRSTADPHSQAAVAASTSRFTGKRVHFIGIGGCGMSGLARMLLDNGAIVTGSEPKPNSISKTEMPINQRLLPNQSIFTS